MVLMMVLMKKRSLVSSASGYGLILVMMAGTVFIGCSAEKPYDQLLKEKVYSKALIDAQAEYLYVPSVMESASFTEATLPQMVGDGKIVRFRFGEKNLDVLEVAPDPVDQRLVLSVPIEHVDYTCEVDPKGECTNREVENNKLSWERKTRFRADFENLDLKEVNTLPIQMARFTQGPDCYSQIARRILSANIEPDAVNIEIERTYRTSSSCVRSGSLRDVNFSVVDHYSLVKLDRLASPDYEPFRYSAKDRRKFGFIDNEAGFLNRWNPKKKEIVYHLSDAFQRPENAAFKKAAEQAVAAINDGLAKAQTNLAIRLSRETGRNAGDLRNNMLVLVDQPVNGGAFGFGFSVDNPRTGEIVSARVALYLGAFKLAAAEAYEEVREELLNRRNENAYSEDLQLLAVAVNGAGAALDASHNNFNPTHPQLLPEPQVPASPPPPQKRVQAHAAGRYEVADRHCYLLESDLDLAEQARKALSKTAEDSGLKPWIALSVSERQKVIEQVVPLAFRHTLVHELGHNLGLRHNFMGSFDRNSSVMDYSAREFNQLTVPGKYDIAALRFGYTGKTSENENYRYCTDEDADAIVGCHRGDEGTTLEEVVRHLIGQYENYYQRRNFGRADEFSSAGDDLYASELAKHFIAIRLYLSHWAVQRPFAKPTELKDMEAAAKLSRDFFVSVIAEPDATCIVVDPANPKKGPTFLTLASTAPGAISCFQPELTEELSQSGLRVVAQGGKFFRSFSSFVNVRGIWIDKLLAASLIFTGDGNERIGWNPFLAFPKSDELVTSLLAGLVTGQLSGSVRFETRSAEKVDLNLPYGLELENAQLIPFQPDQMRQFLALPERETLLSKQILKVMSEQSRHVLYGAQFRDLVDMFSVSARKPEGLEAYGITIGNKNYYFTQRNLLAFTVSRELAAMRIYSGFKNEDRLMEIANELLELEAPENQGKQRPAVADQEKIIWDLGSEPLLRYLSRRGPPASDLERIVEEILIHQEQVN